MTLLSTLRVKSSLLVHRVEEKAYHAVHATDEKITQLADRIKHSNRACEKSQTNRALEKELARRNRKAEVDSASIPITQRIKQKLSKDKIETPSTSRKAKLPLTSILKRSQ